jgi:hypothetical protein
MKLEKKRIEKFVIRGREEATEVVKRRCICKYELGFLTKEEVEKGRIENEICEDCGKIAFGSGLICSSKYIEWAPNYSHGYSEKLVTLLKDQWGIECETSREDGDAIEDCISIGDVANGVFVMNHSLGGRSGPVSSNWASPLDFIRNYESKGPLKIRYGNFWDSVEGKIIEELFLSRFNWTDYIERGGQYYAPAFEFIESPNIPCEIDAVMRGGDPLEICSTWDLGNLNLAAINKKIDQMAVQINTLDADTANLIIISRNSKKALKFAFMTISRDQLLRWTAIKTQILLNSFSKSKEQYEISENLRTYKNVFQTGRLDLRKCVRV